MRRGTKTNGGARVRRKIEHGVRPDYDVPSDSMQDNTVDGPADLRPLARPHLPASQPTTLTPATPRDHPLTASADLRMEIENPSTAPSAKPDGETRSNSSSEQVTLANDGNFEDDYGALRAE